MNILLQVLEELGIPDASAQVYLDLLEFGESTPRKISQRLSVSRTTIYDQVRPLLMRGLVVEVDRSGKKSFVIHDVQDLKRHLISRKEKLKQLETLFEKDEILLRDIGKRNDAKIRFVEGVEGIKTIFHDMLWSEELELRTLWPYNEMLKVVGSEFLEEFNRKRIRQKISIKSIWVDGKVGKDHVWRGGDWKVERRIISRSHKTKMSYTIYGDKVAFVGSSKDAYGFIVHSTDFAELMKMHFSLLWSISRC